jgi:hypothetical protein
MLCIASRSLDDIFICFYKGFYNALRFFCNVCESTQFYVLAAWRGVLILFVCCGVFPGLVYVVVIVV